LKITQNHAKLSQEHSKNLQNTLFLKIPKWLSISEPSHLAHAKKKEKQHQIKEGWYEDIWRLKKQGRILKIYLFSQFSVCGFYTVT
jgi:hypothetical protein